jgi:hypothetical protein
MRKKIERIAVTDNENTPISTAFVLLQGITNTENIFT